MRFIATSAAVALVLGFAGAASAQTLGSSDYGQINLGSGVAGRFNADVSSRTYGSASGDEGLKAGFFGSALVGHDFRNGLALELEGFYGSNNVKTRDLNAAVGYDLNARAQSFGAMANVKVEVPQPYAFGGVSVSPYAAIGAGYGGVNYRLAGESQTVGGFNWQAKAGLALHTGSNLTWDLGYRYLTTAKFDVNDGAGDRIQGRTHIHGVTLGARVAF